MLASNRQHAFVYKSATKYLFSIVCCSFNNDDDDDAMHKHTSQYFPSHSGNCSTTTHYFNIMKRESAIFYEWNCDCISKMPPTANEVKLKSSGTEICKKKLSYCSFLSFEFINNFCYAFWHTHYETAAAAVAFSDAWVHLVFTLNKIFFFECLKIAFSPTCGCYSCKNNNKRFKAFGKVIFFDDSYLCGYRQPREIFIYLSCERRWWWCKKEFFCALSS